MSMDEIEQRHREEQAARERIAALTGMRTPLVAVEAFTAVWKLLAPARSARTSVDPGVLRDGLLQVAGARQAVEAMELQLLGHCRRQGMNWQDIGEALGYGQPRQAAQTRYRRLCSQYPRFSNWAEHHPPKERTAMTKPPCDNASVGVIIERDGKVLLFERALPPIGVAPPAGHVYDEHADYRAAAHAEVAEEVGLTVTELQFVTGGWRTNKCRRAPGPAGPGHQWEIYRATVTGTLTPSARETRNARWVELPEVQALADRTVSYAWGQVTDADFNARPGLELVWVRWLAEAGLITVDEGDLDLIEEILTERALRGHGDHGVTVEIRFQPKDGDEQILWAEVEDWDHLARLQDLIASPDADRATIALSARLDRDGTNYPRAFPAARTRLRELDLDQE
jgi:ADP-ribose pyrophosphatase YjhB (NUDIX family)